MTKKKRLPKAPADHRARAKRAPRLPARVAAAVSGFLAANTVAVRFCLLFPALLLLFWVAWERELNNCPRYASILSGTERR